MRLSKQGERKRPAVVKEERRREAQERGRVARLAVRSEHEAVRAKRAGGIGERKGRHRKRRSCESRTSAARPGVFLDRRTKGSGWQATDAGRAQLDLRLRVTGVNGEAEETGRRGV